MNQYMTYLYLLTPLHTGGSTNEGNLMGIAREVHTGFPYLPASSLRGKVRSVLEGKEDLQSVASRFFGRKIENGQQPTEGEVWFADATLLFFPIASLSHHLIWVTCPLWLDRWYRWLNIQDAALTQLLQTCRQQLDSDTNSAIVSFLPERLYLQTALLNKTELSQVNFQPLVNHLTALSNTSGLIAQLLNKLVVLTDEDCSALVEMGLQREVRIALEEKSKTVKGGSFRAEEAIPPETVLFLPWGIKPPQKFQADAQGASQQQEELNRQQKEQQDAEIRRAIQSLMNGRSQFGGLEGLGRGWTQLISTSVSGEI